MTPDRRAADCGQRFNFNNMYYFPMMFQLNFVFKCDKYLHNLLLIIKDYREIHSEPFMTASLIVYAYYLLCHAVKLTLVPTKVF